MAMPSNDTSDTVEDIFSDYSGRRAALIRALTLDADLLYTRCDPEKEILCLYGYPDGRWKVTFPSEYVPPEIPEPTIGINFARDGMNPDDWRYTLAVHCDSWLYYVTFFNASRLNADERLRLFNLINSLPTVYEVVREWEPVQNTHKQSKSSAASSGSKSKGKSIEASGSECKGKSIEASGSEYKGKSSEASGSKYKGKSSEASGSKARINLNRSSDGQSKSTSNIVEESHVESQKEQEDSRCSSCGKLYQEDEFWILCDFCELWYHGECVNVTPESAKNIGKYACPVCALKQTKP